MTEPSSLRVMLCGGFDLVRNAVGDPLVTETAAEDVADAPLIEALHAVLAAHVRAHPARWNAALLHAFGHKGSALQGRPGHAPPELPAPAAVRFVPPGTLPDGADGADGAYEAASATVYLDASLRKRPAALRETYTEELGHHLDAVLGGGDARGDEGAIFARTLLRDAPRGAELAALRVEHDRGTISADGRTIEVEFDAEPGVAGADPSGADLLESGLSTSLPGSLVDADTFLESTDHGFDETYRLDELPPFGPAGTGFELDDLPAVEATASDVTSSSAPLSPTALADTSTYELPPRFALTPLAPIATAVPLTPAREFTEATGGHRIAGIEHTLPGSERTIQSFTSEGYVRRNTQVELYQVRNGKGDWEVRVRSLIPEGTRIEGSIPDVLVGTYSRAVDVDDFGNRGELAAKTRAAFLQVNEKRGEVVLDERSQPRLTPGDLGDSAFGVVSSVVGGAVGLLGKLEEGVRTIIRTPRDVQSTAERGANAVAERFFPDFEHDFTGASNLILEQRRVRFGEAALPQQYHRARERTASRLGVDTDTYAFKVGEWGGTLLAMALALRNRGGGGGLEVGKGSNPATPPPTSKMPDTPAELFRRARSVTPDTPAELFRRARSVTPDPPVGRVQGTASPVGAGTTPVGVATKGTIALEPMATSVAPTSPLVLPVPRAASTPPVAPPRGIGEGLAFTGTPAVLVPPQSIGDETFVAPEERRISFTPDAPGGGVHTPGQTSREADTAEQWSFTPVEIGAEPETIPPFAPLDSDWTDRFLSPVEVGTPGSSPARRRVDVGRTEEGEAETDIERFPVTLPNEEGGSDVAFGEPEGAPPDNLPLGDRIVLPWGPEVLDPNLPRETADPWVAPGRDLPRSGQHYPDADGEQAGEGAGSEPGGPRNVTPEEEAVPGADERVPETEWRTNDVTAPAQDEPLGVEPPAFGYADPAASAERRHRAERPWRPDGSGTNPGMPGMALPTVTDATPDDGFSPSVPEERFVSDRSSLERPYGFETLGEAQAILDGYGVTLGPIEESNFDPHSEFVDPDFDGTFLSDQAFADSLRIIMPEIIRLEEKYPGLLDGLHLVGMERRQQEASAGYAFASVRTPEIAIAHPDTFAEVLDEASGRIRRPQQSIQATFRHELGHFVLHHKLSEKTRERLLTNNVERPFYVFDDRQAMGVELDLAERLRLGAREILFKAVNPGVPSFTELLREEKVLPEGLRTEDIDPELLDFVLGEVFRYELVDGRGGTVGVRFPLDFNTLQIGERVSRYASTHNDRTYYRLFIDPDNSIGAGRETVYGTLSEDPSLRSMMSDTDGIIGYTTSLLNRFVSREESFAEIFGAYLFDEGNAVSGEGGRLVDGTAQVGERSDAYRLPRSIRKNLESALEEARGVVPEPRNNRRDVVPMFGMAPEGAAAASDDAGDAVDFDRELTAQELLDGAFDGSLSSAEIRWHLGTNGERFVEGARAAIDDPDELRERVHYRMALVDELKVNGTAEVGAVRLPPAEKFELMRDVLAERGILVSPHAVPAADQLFLFRHDERPTEVIFGEGFVPRDPNDYSFIGDGNEAVAYTRMNEEFARFPISASEDGSGVLTYLEDGVEDVRQLDGKLIYIVENSDPGNLNISKTARNSPNTLGRTDYNEVLVQNRDGIPADRIKGAIRLSVEERSDGSVRVSTRYIENGAYAGAAPISRAERRRRRGDGEGSRLVSRDDRVDDILARHRAGEITLETATEELDGVLGEILSDEQSARLEANLDRANASDEYRFNTKQGIAYGYHSFERAMLEIDHYAAVRRFPPNDGGLVRFEIAYHDSLGSTDGAPDAHRWFVDTIDDVADGRYTFAEAERRLRDHRRRAGASADAGTGGVADADEGSPGDDQARLRDFAEELGLDANDFLVDDAALRLADGELTFEEAAERLREHHVEIETSVFFRELEAETETDDEWSAVGDDAFAGGGVSAPEPEGSSEERRMRIETRLREGGVSEEIAEGIRRRVDDGELTVDGALLQIDYLTMLGRITEENDAAFDRFAVAYRRATSPSDDADGGLRRFVDIVVRVLDGEMTFAEAERWVRSGTFRDEL